MVYGRAGGGVGGMAIGFEQLFYPVQQGFFGGVVGGAELFGALEHKVFEVVSQTGGFGRVVLASDAHGDVGLDTGFVFVYRHE